MDVTTLIGNLFFSLILTAIVYLLVPVILVISNQKFTQRTLKTITICNGIGGVIFYIFLYAMLDTGEAPSVWVAALWSSIGYAILKRTSLADKDSSHLDDNPNRVTQCLACGYKSKEYFNACPRCGKHAKQYVYQKEETVETDTICFCRKCGSKLLDNASFCSKCGTQIVKE